MESSARKQGTDIFIKRGLFGHFYDFCSIGELAQLACLCKASKAAINQVFSDRLMDEGVAISPCETDFLRLYKEIHIKSVILLPLASLNSRDKVDVFSGAKITKKTMFVDKIIKDFSFGIKFVGYHMDSNDLIIITKVDYLSMNKQTLAKSENHRCLKHVSRFNLEARQVTVLDSERNLKVVYYLKGKNIHQMPEILLDQQVEDYQLNYNYLAYRSQQGDFFLYSKYSDMNLGQATKYKISMPCSTYSMTLSGLNFYIKDESLGKYYAVNLNTLDPIVVEGNTSVKHLAVTEWTFPCRKPITGVFPGLRNEIISCEEQYKSSMDWSTEEVRDWFRSIGVSNIDNILRFDKFTGDQLKQIDTSMMIERFGIKNTDVHNKILSEIKLEQEKTNHEPDLFGIGYNLDGQLCLNNGHKNVSMWTKIKFPSLANTDCIKDIIFGWCNTLVITKEGRLFLSYKRPKKRADEEEAEEEAKLIKGLKGPAKRSNPGRKQSEALQGYSSNEVNENVHPNRKKRGSKKLDENQMSDEDSDCSDDFGAERGLAKQSKKKKKGQVAKAERGIKKERRKFSFQPNDLKKEDDEGVAKWVEITNLFQINKYA